MGQAELSVRKFLGDSAEVSGAASWPRGVPADWFVDPADPVAARSNDTANRTFLEATAFLASHDLASHELTGHELADDAGTSVEQPAHTAVPVWIGLRPGLDDFRDEGELGWQTDALCAQTDPEAFFPEKGGSTRDAKKVCGACNVKAQCLEYALANDERFGIWGGLSERERRRLRKRAV